MLIEKTQALLKAAGEGEQEKLAELLRGTDEHFSVNSRDEDGWSALHQAAKAGHAEMISYLLVQGGDYQAQSKSGWTPLHQAAFNGRKLAVEVLLSQAKARGDNDYSERKEEALKATALHFAAHQGHDKVVTVLLSQGANYQVQDKYGWTALHRAALKGHTLVLEALLSHGRLQRDSGYLQGKGNEYGYTALHCAAHIGHVAAMNFLARRGGSYQAKDKLGRTPLRCAIFRGHISAVIEVLLACGANQGGEYWLDLSGCTLTDKQLIKLARVLKTNQTLRKLNLAGNAFSHTGMWALAEGLKHNKTLKLLDLRENRIGARWVYRSGIQYLADALKSNTDLVKVNNAGV